MMIREALKEGRESLRARYFMLDRPLVYYQGFYRFIDACCALMKRPFRSTSAT